MYREIENAIRDNLIPPRDRSVCKICSRINGACSSKKEREKGRERRYRLFGDALYERCRSRSHATWPREINPRYDSRRCQALSLSLFLPFPLSPLPLSRSRHSVPLQIHARGSRRYALDDRSMFRFSAEKRDFLSFHGSESANPLILHTLAAAAASDLYIISYSPDATRECGRYTRCSTEARGGSRA